MKTGERVLVIDPSSAYWGDYGYIYAITSTGTVIVEFENHSKVEFAKHQLQIR